MPTVSYFLASIRHPIDDKHLLWNQPLPTSRYGSAAAERCAPEDENLSYANYFSAVTRFCAESGWKRVLLAAADRLEKPLAVDDLGPVSIFLEKHGAFYHPARIEVTAAGQRLCLVANVAVSRLGKEALFRETKALAHLNEHRPFGWFPTVYAVTDENPPMFLGDWFDGFHEFHLTREKEIGEPRLVIWDGAVPPRLLSEKQAAALYRTMAMILTACYDPVTTCQIFPWHHAAGDFVVRIKGEKVSAKLITVRNYAPLTNASGPEDENGLLETVLLFFLHLSVRIRLDRLDGVSEVVWAPDSCLAPTIDGFFQGLDLTARLSGFPETFPRIFKRFAELWRYGDLLPMARQVVETVFDRHSEERHVIESNLTNHVAAASRLLAGRPA